jgi:tripartite-type tricarboxylate transporter receptor subunit TctC
MIRLSNVTCEVMHNVMRTVCLAAMALSAHAQTGYPTKSIRIVVPYFPGTPSDLAARMLGQKFNEAWGKPVVIENAAGASGNIGTERVARANPDGYSLVLPGNAPLAINPSLYPNLPFNPLKDFAPISQVTLSASILAVQSSQTAKSVQELVALAKTQPGKLTYGTGGSGTPQHMAGELLNTMAGIRIVHVPYKGPPPSLLDLVGGRLTAVFGISSVVLPLSRSDKVRALAVTSLQRTAAAPDVPTMAESGFPGFEATSWFALLAPAGTPQTIVRKIHGETVRALAQPDIRARLTDLGMDVVGSTPEQLAAIMRAEIPKWAKVVKDSGAKLD